MPALNPAEQSKVKRERRIAKGLCPGCGRSYTGRFQYCKLCREKNTIRNKNYRELRHRMIKEIEKAEYILSCFKGTTLIERAQNARKYYESVEGALV